MSLLGQRFEKELTKLQKVLQKEGNLLLKRIKKADLTSNLDKKRKELEDLVEKKLKGFEPAYHKFITELQKQAKNAGLDLVKLEKQLKKGAKAAKKTLGAKAGKLKVTKKVQTKIRAAKKTLGKVKKATPVKKARAPKAKKAAASSNTAA